MIAKIFVYTTAIEIQHLITNELKAYKKSLIYEAVTGKREV